MKNGKQYNTIMPSTSSNGNSSILQGTANKFPEEMQAKITKYIPELDCVSQADATDIQHVAAANLALNERYHESMIKQAKRSFICALIAASVGLAFFLGAAAFLMQQVAQLYLVTSLGAAITALVSGTSFYLYRCTLKHFEAFHICVARTELILLENSICMQIHDAKERDTAYLSVVENIEKLAVLVSTYEQKPSR